MTIRPPLRRRDAGTSLIEMLLVIASFAPVAIAFGTLMDSYSDSASLAHRQVDAIAESQRILRAIAAELTTGSTTIGHAVPGGTPLPHGESAAQTTQDNAFYCRDAYGWTPPMDHLHETESRDGYEHWTPEWASRKFYIYATFAPFDTIEYQKIRTPVGALGDQAIVGDNILNPWSRPRKILRDGEGNVLLIVQGLPGEPESRVVLGRNAEDLKFHLNPDRHLVVRLVVRGGSARPGVPPLLRMSQITIRPRTSLQ